MATTTNNGWTTPNDTDLVKDGALAIRTLGNGIDTSVGTGLLAWQTYTPTVSGTGWVKGSGTTTGRYCQIGKTVHFEANYTFSSAGGGTAGTGALVLSLPPVAASATISPNYVNVIVFDTSTGALYLGIGAITTTATVCYCINAGSTFAALNNVTSTTPMTWATGDEVRVNGTYECV